MVLDSRFYDFKGPLSLQALRDICGFEPISKSDVPITGIAPSGRAGDGDLCFYEGRSQAAASVSTRASACFVRADAAAYLPDKVIPLIVEHPRHMHARAATALFALKNWTDQGSPPAIDKTVRLGPGAYIGSGAAIGPDTIIGPNTVIGPGVQIGKGTMIGANTSIQCALIGDHVKIASGAIIGESGFGVMNGIQGPEDIPQWGRVVIEDRVTVGAGTCIDRGAFDDTFIGAGSKIDNLCHIAHNVTIGRNVIMAGFAGVSGSCVINDGVVMGGRVSIATHVTIGSGARLAGLAGIFKDVPPGQTWAGTPAKLLRTHLREVAWLKKQVASKRKSS